MYSTIDKFASSGLINRDEAASACDAEAAGTDTHTIGYEVEVLASARPDISRAKNIRYNDDLYWKCYDKLGPYGYDVGMDGLYEIQSPVAKHPHSLEVATRGLANYGWLPKKGTKGLVTSHVSVGTSINIGAEDYSTLLEHTTDILRAVEMFGGSTPTRLSAPLRSAFKGDDDIANKSWNQKGEYGVKMVPIGRMNKTFIAWEGDNSRIEFRTLGYYNPKQYGAMLNAVYFLTRGLFTSDESAGEIYDNYSDWIRDYYDANDLPRMVPHEGSSRREVLDEYLSPYVDHLAHADLTDMRNKTSETIRDLQEEFRMTDVPFDDSHLVDAGSSLPFRR